MTRLSAIAIASLLTVAGCGTTANQKAAIAGLESALTTTDLLATDYTSLPPCPGPTLCASPVIKTQIKMAAQNAFDTVMAAEKSVQSGATVDLTAANAAMTAFQGIVADLQPAPKGN